MSLKIGSIEIPIRSAIDLDQTYETIGGETILRTIDGTGIKQTTWGKMKTVISGSGWIPTGLATIDTTTQHTVSCVVPRSVACDINRQATIPAARRSDTGYTPWALAVMPDSGTVETPISFVGNVATVTGVAGAIGYQVLYYPEITAWINRPTDSGKRSDATYSWEIIAEEV